MSCCLQIVVHNCTRHCWVVTRTTRENNVRGRWGCLESDISRETGFDDQGGKDFNEGLKYSDLKGAREGEVVQMCVGVI